MKQSELSKLPLSFLAFAFKAWNKRKTAWYMEEKKTQEMKNEVVCLSY